MKHNIEEYRKTRRSSNGLAAGKDFDRGQNDTKTGPTPTEKDTYYRRCMWAMLTHTAISSDDPNAIEKLIDRLDKLLEMQVFMKAANRCIKTENKAAFLKTAFGTDKLWEQLHTQRYHHGTGFSKSELTSNNGTIRRICKRIDALKQMAASTTTEKIVKGIRVVKNFKAKRLQLIFRSRPSEEVKARLYRVHSFTWYVRDLAWHRFLNPHAVYEAEQFLAWYEPDK